MHLVGFTIQICYDARSYKRQISRRDILFFYVDCITAFKNVSPTLCDWLLVIFIGVNGRQRMYRNRVAESCLVGVRLVPAAISVLRHQVKIPTQTVKSGVHRFSKHLGAVSEFWSPVP